MNANICVDKTFRSALLALRYITYADRTFAPSCAQVTMVEFPEGGTCEPTLTLDATEAQQLMDELWKCGVRPTEGAGSAGAMAAVQNHLKDLQRLVFKGGDGD